MNATEKIKSALRRLQLSDSEQAIYLSLITEGEASARTLASRTGITRPSVYDQLKSLRQLGLVNELDIEGKAQFAASHIKHLESLLNDHIDRLEQSRDFLKDALPSLENTFKTFDPKVRFFEGSEGVKQLLKDIMWHDNETMRIIWAADAMDEVFAETFIKWFDERRAKRSLTVHSLWPKNSVNDLGLFTQKGDKKKELAPKDVPTMTSIMYGNKVAFISSNAEAFGFIVESTEFSNLQLMQFKKLWS